ncbi:GNAT family N-acetyltransferase [Effusibacillus lacus]|uniref:N-acetyltransferase n=1 Tax=Effusibacillus lacus TaxID=1348429 RepID=A0A292YH93_9BACL|nr:GNAT family N-acetyltransferase [Effusibacillus lacus]TCS68282.1 acetyltransferase (GNAT) family protein [Effusibacillus lacus]GAX90167.1 N-acetyltransferase [Effusibacillus lacus]
MITMKRLSECALEQAVQAWNEGFKGYFFDASTTVDAFTARMGKEGLSPSLSIVAFLNGQPAGLVLNGVRNLNGKKVAWNGGTGVAPEFRKQRVGMQLIAKTLEIYQEEQVEIATLEAVSENEPAIALYERMGYVTTDRLLFFHHEGPLPDTLSGGAESSPFRIRRGIAQDVRMLPFYNHMSPWQTQWTSAIGGESAIAYDAAGEALGYALFHRTFDDSGRVGKITLLQCEAKPEVPDKQPILTALLAEAYSSAEDSVIRGTFNLPQSNEIVVQLHRKAGFTIRAEQVNMIRQML